MPLQSEDGLRQELKKLAEADVLWLDFWADIKKAKRFQEMKNWDLIDDFKQALIKVAGDSLTQNSEGRKVLEAKLAMGLTDETAKAETP